MQANVFTYQICLIRALEGVNDNKAPQESWGSRGLCVRGKNILWQSFYQFLSIVQAGLLY